VAAALPLLLAALVRTRKRRVRVLQQRTRARLLQLQAAAQVLPL